jgi:hypothetical protein
MTGKQPKPGDTSADLRTARADARAADLRTTTIKKLQASGITSMRGIATALNNAVTRTCRGKERWQAIQVRRVLARLSSLISQRVVRASCLLP